MAPSTSVYRPVDTSRLRDEEAGNVVRLVVLARSRLMEEPMVVGMLSDLAGVKKGLE